MVGPSNAEHDSHTQASEASHTPQILLAASGHQAREEYDLRLQEALNERDTFEERQCNFQQELERLQQSLQEQEQHFHQERQSLSAHTTAQVEQALQEQDRIHAQSLRDEVGRLQAEHQRQIMESTQATTEMEDRLRRLEAAQLQREHQDLSATTAAEVQQHLEEQHRNHQQALHSEITRLQNEHQQQMTDATQAREEMETRIQELEQVQAQQSSLTEQVRLSAQAAARSEEAYETVANINLHNSEVIAELQAQLEARTQRLEASLNESSHPAPATSQEPVGRPPTHATGAHQRLPLDTPLTRMRAASIARDGPSERRVSFDTENLEETITPPLRISRPYSSSNPQIPRLRLTTPQPSPARFNPQLSLQFSSLARCEPMSPASSMRRDPTPGPSFASASTPWLSDEQAQTPSHQRAGTSTYRANNLPSYASSRAASLTPPREPTPGPSDNFASILNTLIGSVNSLREEVADTRDAFATMNSSLANTPIGFRVTQGLSRHSPYKALPAPRHKDQGRTDMMKIMRNSLKNKLAIKHDKDIKQATQNGQHMASPEEVDNFDRGEIPAPALIPFRPYWDDIHCLWNGSLADQFIDELLAAGHDFDGETRQNLKDYFFQRLSTLRKELKRQATRVNETTQQAEQRAETQHLVTLARNRVQMRQKS
ncbi:hypothetical protein C0992_012147, partial [Termitomyces sp. T32_za158]